MQADVVILGAAGYGGGELLRLLSAHPQVGVLTPVSRSMAGKPVTGAHPHLHPLAELKFAGEARWDALDSSAPLIVFSAMQHGELAAVFPALQSELENLRMRRRVILIDLSGDFRLRDAARYAQYYGGVHPCPEFLGSFVYGLPEQHREQLREANWIASPGCFATAMCLALLPLAGSGHGALPLHVAVIGVTGSSGSGTHPSATTHHPARAHDFRAYTPLVHRHLGEVEQLLEAAGGRGLTLSFVPHSGPFVRGIHVTAQCALPDGIGADDVRELFAMRYAGESFVRIVTRPPRVATVAGSNYAEVAVFTRGRQLAVLCALDNLGKGMAGQAVQSMNIALGFHETTALMNPGVYP